MTVVVELINLAQKPGSDRTGVTYLCTVESVGHATMELVPPWCGLHWSTIALQ